jgi:hypothetical protein
VRRTLLLLLVLALPALGSCGKYGPPRRAREVQAPAGAASGSPILVPPLGPEGTSILNPTTDDPASPLAPPEEPEEEEYAP